MELLGNKLEFGNQKQKLIVRRLDEDYIAMSRIKYLEQQTLTQEDRDLIAKYNGLQKEIGKEPDKYLKSLMKLQCDDIIEKLMKPIMEKQKKFYEINFDMVINEKRMKERDKIRKHLKKSGLDQKDGEEREIILDR